MAQAEVALQLESGRRLLAFPLPDGAFSFAAVPDGVHTLTADVRGLIYPIVRLDVGDTHRGKVAAVAADATGVRKGWPAPAGAWNCGPAPPASACKPLSHRGPPCCHPASPPSADSGAALPPAAAPLLAH